jgi:single-strand DNA-binding protein
MLTLTGSGRLTRKPELRETSSGSSVTTVAIASSRRGSDDDPIYVDLVLWDAQAAFAVEHLVKGQAVTFAGRLEPRPWTDREGNQRVALEVHGVDLEYGAKPRSAGASEPAEEVPA